MNVGVLGLGSVGTVSALCLVRDGHHVVGCDIDTDKLEILRRGHSPIVEPGIEALAIQARDSGRLRLTADAAKAVAASCASLVCVGTPATADGSQDLSALLRLCEEIGPALRDAGRPLIAVRSTVLPGTLETVLVPALERASGVACGAGFDVAFLPEFLREGSSIHDYDHPPFTVVGIDNDDAAAPLRELYGHLPGELHLTSVRTAELLKYSCNTFHALKITFANEMGRLAAALDVDAHEVMRLLCLDRQLNMSPAYLRPGFAFGGPCLPKDLQALAHLAGEKGVSAPVIAAVLPSNNVHIEVATAAVLESAPKTVGMLGLTFKRGTDDLRSSPLVELARRLDASGVSLRAHEPDLDFERLLGANRRFALNALPNLHALLVPTASALMTSCDVLVIGRNDERFVQALRERARDSHTVIDLVGLDPAALAELRCKVRRLP